MVPLESVRLLLESLSRHLASLAAMKKLLRFLGFLSAMGAIAWAMRDRFISLTVPREPEPPTFREPPPVPHARPAQPKPVSTDEVVHEVSGGSDDLTEVDGVGPVYASRLTAAGVTTFSGLASLTEEQLGDILGSRLSRIPSILEDAKRRSGS